MFRMMATLPDLGRVDGKCHPYIHLNTAVRGRHHGRTLVMLCVLYQLCGRLATDAVVARIVTYTNLGREAVTACGSPSQHTPSTITLATPAAQVGRGVSRWRIPNDPKSSLIIEVCRLNSILKVETHTKVSGGHGVAARYFANALQNSDLDARERMISL